MTLSSRIRAFIRRHIVGPDRAPVTRRDVAAGVSHSGMPRYVPMVRCVHVGHWAAGDPQYTVTGASVHAHSTLCHWGDLSVIVDLETGDVVHACEGITEREAQDAAVMAQLTAAFSLASSRMAV